MNPSSRFPYLHLTLFVLTFLSTLIWGAVHWIGFYNPQAGGKEIMEIFKSFRFLYLGLPFSLSIMLILLSHEMGHYIAARTYGIDTTLPYFIPAPNIIGTFGAVIKIKGHIPSRKALFDVGAAGPITGFIVSLPFLIYGLANSRILTNIPKGGLSLGEPLIFKLICKIYYPGISSDLIFIHPVGFAAWVGLFVTSLNLLPVSQLDGGHISYAVLGKDSKKLSFAIFAFLLYLGAFKWWVWLIWAGLIMIIGVYHPEFVYEDKLDPKRYIIALFVLLVFLLTFIPQPFIFSH